MRRTSAPEQRGFRISREALGPPDEVEVPVRAAETGPDGGPAATDWLGKPRSFTDWVAQ